MPTTIDLLTVPVAADVDLANDLIPFLNNSAAPDYSNTWRPHTLLDAFKAAIAAGSDGQIQYANGSGGLTASSKLLWDHTTNKEGLTVTSGGDSVTATQYASNLLFGGTRGLLIRSTNATAYFPNHIRIENSAYNTFMVIMTGDKNGAYFNSYGNALWAFESTFAGGVNGIRISSDDTLPALKVTSDAAQKAFAIQLAASQTADALQILPNGSSTPLTFFDKLGAWSPASMADSSAPNNSVYYSTTASKLVYKNSAGTVNALY